MAAAPPPPTGRRPARWPQHRVIGALVVEVAGTVSRLDTALSAVRTVLTLRLAPVLLGVQPR